MIMGKGRVQGINGLTGFKRTFPIGNDVKYRGKEYDPHSPYIPKGQYAVATKIVALDGSGDFEDIQSAIDDLPSGGGVVYIKEGTYNVKVPITIKESNISLIGAGFSTIIFLVSGSNCHVIHIGDGSTTLEGINISNLKIDGNRDNNTGDISGMYYEGGSSNKITTSYITNCFVTKGNRNGIKIKYTKDFIVSQNFVNSNYRGIYANYGEYLIISNNQCNSNGDMGISLGYVNNSTIVDNQCNSNTNTAFYMIYSSYNKVSGNHCTINYIGFALGVCDYNIIAYNYIISNTHQGLVITSSSSDINSLISNYFYDNNSANIVDSGTDTRYGHNVIL